MHRHRTPHWGDEGTPPWAAGPRAPEYRRRFIFRGLFFLMVTVGVIFLTALVVGYTLGRSGTGQPWHVPLVGLCFLPFVIGGLLLILGSLAFRRYATPLAEIMSAADAVAEGDFSVRVPEAGSMDFRRLAHSFNRMTAELDRAEQQRRNLTADVAHELRTPLHIIQGNLEGVLDGVYQPTEAHISAILEETRHLSRLVEDLQTLSLAEAGQLPLNIEKVSAAELIEDTLDGFAGPASSAGVEIRPDIPAEIAGAAVLADPVRMVQVLSNLAANALRYTPSGGVITLGIRAAWPAVELRVQDTGSGIPAEDLPFVFDRFWRGDRTRARLQGAGSGLGLAIARQLVEAQSGKIRVESNPGAGTTFTITLPSAEETG